MRFKTAFLSRETKHASLVSCVTWISEEEIYSCGDDHCIYKWNTVNQGCSKIAELSADIFPTTIHCLPRLSSKKSGSDMLLLTCSDGKFHLLGMTGRLEKTVEAHKGAILMSQISRDLSSILTGAEDGTIKVWSRSAMLRSTVANASSPVFACDWSGDSQNVVYAQADSIVLKPLSPSLSATKWKAHDAVILCVAWNPSLNTIASGAEDCKYKVRPADHCCTLEHQRNICTKVWDPEGRLLYTCSNQGFPITKLAWNLTGQLLAVGAHNTLRLCHSTGWSYSLEKLNSGSLYDIAWAKDNSQIAVACGNGHVLSACVVDRELEAGSIQVQMTDRQVVKVRDLQTSDHWEVLETKSPVLQLVAGYEHVAMATSGHCTVYNVKSVNTPAEFKLAGVFLLQLTSKYLLAVNEHGYWVYTLGGKPVNLPKQPVQAQQLTQECISISNDCLAIRDHIDERVVHLLEIGSLRAADNQNQPRLRHSESIKRLALNHTEGERCLAIVDSRADLYIAPNPNSSTARFYKMASMVCSLRWNSQNSYLAAITESQLLVWFYPQTIILDRSLLRNTIYEKDLSEVGPGSSIIQFCGCLLDIRRQDQVTLSFPLSPAPEAIHLLTERGQWEQALALLRSGHGLRPGCLHSVYAARCRAKMQPRRALVAYSALGCVDSVELLMSLD